MKSKLALAHMRSAFNYASLSTCERRKVGCVIVTDNFVILGYNGTPPGWDNCCEDEDGNTKPEVRHAELNAASKLARSHESSEGASAFITLSPCIECATLLATAGIKEVYYAEEYAAAKSASKGESGLEYLARHGIPTYHLPIEQK